MLLTRWQKRSLRQQKPAQDAPNVAFSSLANAVVVVVAALGSKSAEMEGTPNLTTRGKKALVSAKAQVSTNGAY